MEDHASDVRVVDAARQAIRARNHQVRREAVGGDFFQAVPPGGFWPPERL